MTAAEILFTGVWWRYDPAHETLGGQVYCWFNLAEGVVWLVFAILVLMRFARHRNSLLEVIYALCFVLFGLTDFVEAGQLSSWLIWLKLAVLIGLLLVRRTVIRRYYPASKAF